MAGRERPGQKYTVAKLAFAAARDANVAVIFDAKLGPAFRAREMPPNQIGRRWNWVHCQERLRLSALIIVHTVDRFSPGMRYCGLEAAKQAQFYQLGISCIKNPFSPFFSFPAT